MYVAFFLFTLCTVNVSSTPAYPLEAAQSFGFHENGTFSITINSTFPGHVICFLSTDPKTGYTKDVKNVCPHFDSPLNLPFIEFYLNSENDSFTWDGSVATAGIHYVFLKHCDVPSARFEISCRFRNGNSLLDSREDYLPVIYFVTAAVYSVLSIIWLVNAAWFPRFRVPLHTIFLVLPLLHTLNSAVLYTCYGARAVGITPPIYKQYFVSLIRCVYIALFLAGVSLVASGFCVFRSNISPESIQEIVCSSIQVAICVISLPYAKDFASSFALLAGLFASFMWWVQIITMNIVMVSRLKKASKLDSTVFRKVALCKKFLVSQFHTLGLTCLSAFFSIHPYAYSSLSIIFLEIGLFFASFRQLQFFLLRKEYCGEIFVEPQVIIAPAILVEPGKRSLVVLSTTS